MSCIDMSSVIVQDAGKGKAKKVKIHNKEKTRTSVEHWNDLFVLPERTGTTKISPTSEDNPMYVEIPPSPSKTTTTSCTYVATWHMKCLGVTNKYIYSHRRAGIEMSLYPPLVDFFTVDHL